MFLLIAGMATVLCAKNQARQLQAARQISCLTGAILPIIQPEDWRLGPWRLHIYIL